LAVEKQGWRWWMEVKKPMQQHQNQNCLLKADWERALDQLLARQRSHHSREHALYCSLKAEQGLNRLVARQRQTKGALGLLLVARQQRREYQR
jgi:hypothetical protein